MKLRLAGIVLLLTAVYLVGNESVGLWDRDEPRYAQASRQMLESGDWTTPRLLDELRLKKPALIYWCQAGAMKLFTISASAARLPSVVATVLTLLLIAVAITKAADSRLAIWTVFIYGTSALTVAAAKMCITDAVLTLFILAAQVCLYRMWTGRRCWLTVIGLGVSIGLAGLTKGPVVLGVLATTCIALWLMKYFFGGTDTSSSGADIPVCHRVPRDTKTTQLFKYLSVPAIAIAIITPWIIALEHAHPGAVSTMIGKEVLDRMAKPQEGHTGPPGFYLLSVWGTFFPWSLLLPAAMVEGFRCRRDPVARFALAAVIGPWIMFELIVTKLPHYVLPTFAPLALLTARVLLRSADGLSIELRQSHWPKVAAIWAILISIIAFWPWLAVWQFGPLPTTAIVGSVLVTAFGITTAIFAYRYFAKHQPTHAAIFMGAGFLAIVVTCFALVFPYSPYLQLSQRAAAVLPKGLAVGDAIMIDYKETSLAFYQGGTIRPEPRNDYLAAVPPDQWPGWIITTGDIWKDVPATSKQLLDVIERINGWSYADGNRRVELLVLRKKTMNSIPR